MSCQLGRGWPKGEKKILKKKALQFGTDVSGLYRLLQNSVGYIHVNAEKIIFETTRYERQKL